MLKIGDRCGKLDCTGHYREVLAGERAGKTGGHPFVLNPGLVVGQCDVCGMAVMGLERRDPTPASD